MIFGNFAEQVVRLKKSYQRIVKQFILKKPDSRQTKHQRTNLDDPVSSFYLFFHCE